jgi:hypothetical protein
LIAEPTRSPVDNSSPTVLTKYRSLLFLTHHCSCVHAKTLSVTTY